MFPRTLNTRSRAERAGRNDSRRRRVPPARSIVARPLSLARSFLLLEDDYDVDWEVDQDEPAGETAARGMRRRARIRIDRRCAGAASATAGQRPGATTSRGAGQTRRRRCPDRGGRAGEYGAGRVQHGARRPERSMAVRAASEKTGGDLLSQALASQVPSALRGLTALFGMGRGVSPSPKPPEKGERPRLPRSLKTAQRHCNEVSQKYPSSPRPISTGLLRTLPPFQIRPINLVVYQGSYSL